MEYPNASVLDIKDGPSKEDIIKALFEILSPTEGVRKLKFQVASDIDETLFVLECIIDSVSRIDGPGPLLAEPTHFILLGVCECDDNSFIDHFPSSVSSFEAEFDTATKKGKFTILFL